MLEAVEARPLGAAIFAARRRSSKPLHDQRDLRAQTLWRTVSALAGCTPKAFARCVDGFEIECARNRPRRSTGDATINGTPSEKPAFYRIYGYRSVPGKPGELEIVPHEAAIVRRIFQE